jgi:hypothetical protein
MSYVLLSGRPLAGNRALTRCPWRCVPDAQEARAVAKSGGAELILPCRNVAFHKARFVSKIASEVDRIFALGVIAGFDLTF